MDQLMQQEASAAAELDASKDDDDEMDPEELMECVICNQASGVSLDRPIALVTLAMATSGKEAFLIEVGGAKGGGATSTGR